MWFGPLLAGLSRLFGTRIGQWVLSALAFLGIYYASSNFVVEPLLAWIQSQFSGVPDTAVRVVAYIGFDVYITATLSAYATAAAGSALKLRKRTS